MTDTVYLGKYPLEPDGEPKPIPWLVIGRKNDRLLLVSKYCLHWLPYSEHRAGCWKYSSLRLFLRDFCRRAFTKAEKQRIARPCGSVFRRTTDDSLSARQHHMPPGQRYCKSGRSCYNFQ